jgi:hypothetical protein
MQGLPVQAEGIKSDEHHNGQQNANKQAAPQAGVTKVCHGLFGFE